jgi:hypothetical protein
MYNTWAKGALQKSNVGIQSVPPLPALEFSTLFYSVKGQNQRNCIKSNNLKIILEGKATCHIYRKIQKIYCEN